MSNAPDRIWVQGNSWHERRYALAAGWVPVEYLRKGAFPVEGARRALNHYDHWRQRTGEEVLADGAIVMYLRSILSLLEGANGGMGDE